MNAWPWNPGGLLTAAPPPPAPSAPSSPAPAGRKSAERPLGSRWGAGEGRRKPAGRPRKPGTLGPHPRLRDQTSLSVGCGENGPGEHASTWLLPSPHSGLPTWMIQLCRPKMKAGVCARVYVSVCQGRSLRRGHKSSRTPLLRAPDSWVGSSGPEDPQ